MNKPVLCALTVAAASLAAHADIITFNNDPLGPTPGGFQSVDSSIVTFSTQQTGGLFVGYTVEENSTPSLATFNNSSGGLIMYFSIPQTSLSFDFGNDVPGMAPAGSVAVLTLYQGPWQVAQFSVPLNINDAMDQSIGGSYAEGGGFDRATFHYRNSLGVSINLAEVIDNVTFAPTPGAAAALGLGALAGLRRRR